MKGCSAFKTIPSSFSTAIFLFFMMPTSKILCLIERLPFISHSQGKLMCIPPARATNVKKKGAACPKPVYPCTSSPGPRYSEIFQESSPAARAGWRHVGTLSWVIDGVAVELRRKQALLGGRQEAKSPFLHAGVGQCSCTQVAQMWKYQNQGRNNPTSTCMLSLEL